MERNKNRVKQRIADLGLNYRIIGDEIGITPQAVSEIANGRTVSPTARYAVARVLDSSVDDLWPEAGARAA